MLDRLTRAWRGIRRRFNRADWARKLLKLPVSDGPAADPGLVMIQIDGLGRGELERALAAGRMPFLQRLIHREGYRLGDFYAGVPSTTPAVQAELFYGVRQAVPAFSYLDRRSGRRQRLFEAAAARAKEAELARQGAGLLAGGSAYANIYRGGAREAHFCIADMGWADFIRHAHPGRMALIFALNAYSFVRMVAVAAVELADAVRQADPMTDRRHLLKELKFIPTRVGINAILREFQVIGARMDIQRGHPIIHLNFLGYDETAHRRGPASRFAHRPLRGIDDAIARIWRDAAGAARRDYRIWLYSDHGQESVASFAARHGESLEAAVQRLAQHAGLAGGAPVARAPTDTAPTEVPPSPGMLARRAGRHAGAGEQSQRVRMLGGRRAPRWFPVTPRAEAGVETPPLQVAAMGPLGHIYLRSLPGTETRRWLARALVQRLAVPLVLVPDADGAGVTAYTPTGDHNLATAPAAVLGAAHPYLAETRDELIALSRHRDSGDLIVAGWHPPDQPMSFPVENGAHGGPGAREVSGFTLLPPDARVPSRRRADGGAYRRALDLRRAARDYLGRNPRPRSVPPGGPGQPPTSWAAPRDDTASTPDPGLRLRLVTYNVHSCRGTDGKLSPRRVAAVLDQLAPDVIALQELDVARARTGGVDQARAIADHLRMAVQFHPALRLAEAAYGNAILTPLPMRVVKAGPLPGLPGRPRLEPRGALWVEIATAAGPLQVITTHLGLNAAERRRQVAALMGADWLAGAPRRGPRIVLGDFNARPGSPEIRRLASRFQDTAATRPESAARTFFAQLPVTRIDYIFAEAGLTVRDVAVGRGRLARTASDHLPVCAELTVPARAWPATGGPARAADIAGPHPSETAPAGHTG